MIRKVGYRVYPYDKTICSPAGEAAGRRRPVALTQVGAAVHKPYGSGAMGNQQSAFAVET